ncbi:hypothetical protein MTQ13_19665 [Streptomyces sp. XM4011]|uniref:hypothetical protein n=1 Tax=Streptomyces sp. XM4011 TaxID=2929780 RepID=UPI001FF9D263|nr:hypothetical protein [Streptomyces sp. XM4011]MCK1816470.1 hypothetical protein [Streptomyces sp. XM4011]
MTDRRRASGRQDRPGEEHNPFAPPPEGQPDRPWQFRRDDSGNGDSGGRGGTGSGGGNGSGDGGNTGGSNGDDENEDNQRSRWGSQWSRRQPGRGTGGFGQPPQQPGEEPGGRPFGPRWDPTDPRQRHARYALLAGLWGIFAGLLGWEWLGLLLGALALYWGISGLRGAPREETEKDGKTGTDEQEPHHRATVAQVEGEAPRPGPGPTATTTPPAPRRSPVGMAIGGVVLAGLALLIVFTTYTVQLVYKDYFDCHQDALTTTSREACEDLLPERLRPILGDRN